MMNAGTKSVLSRFSKVSKSKASMIKFKNQTERSPVLSWDKYDDKINSFEEKWLGSVSLCKPFYIQKDNLGLFEKIQFNFNYGDLKNKKGVKFCMENGYESLLEGIEIPHSLLFTLYNFDLKQFIEEERKFVLIIKEIQLLNLIGSIINGLSLCRNLKLPHGNLSLTTIFKKGKFEWEISPPLYSKINLHTRRTTEEDYIKIGVSGELATDYLLAPEEYKLIDKKKECKTYFLYNF